MNIEKLHELVERKTETVKTLEALLEKEDTELVELERKLEALEDKEEGPAQSSLAGLESSRFPAPTRNLSAALLTAGRKVLA